MDTEHETKPEQNRKLGDGEDFPKKEKIFFTETVISGGKKFKDSKDFFLKIIQENRYKKITIPAETITKWSRKKYFNYYVRKSHITE